MDIILESQVNLSCRQYFDKKVIFLAQKTRFYSRNTQRIPLIIWE